MTTKVSDMTVEELKELISESVRESMEDIMEDFLALQSEEYLKSIEEAREDYRKGRVKSFEELFKGHTDKKEN